MSEKIAREIVKRRMEAPAILALELHKPVANINAHLALGAAGFLAPVVGFDRFNDLTRLIAKRDNIEHLLGEIERQASERDDAPSLEENKA